MMLSGIASAAVAIATAASPASEARSLACAAMKEMSVPELTISGSAPAADPVPHCKIDGVIGGKIGFSVWLPEAWNGKFVMGGQGGFGGSVDSQALAMGALQKGYATAGTDSGHVANGVDSRWAFGDMEAIVNYGHVAVHRTTVTAKFLIERRYGRAPAKSYFAGCSNGGRQGLMAAQRYPEDFDAIVAGAPAIDFNLIASTFVNAVAANYPDPADFSKAVISTAERERVGEAALTRCDANDGLIDGVISHPDACPADLEALVCKKQDTDQCLSRSELRAFRRIYDGFNESGRSVGSRFPVGGENISYGWGAWLIGAKDAIAPGIPNLAFPYGVGYLRNFVLQDREWNYPQMEFDGLEARARLVQSALSPIDADLTKFRARGGKLLMYHGWADSGLSPFMSIEYADRVYAKDATARDDVRLFLLPGVLHCSGGPGPDRIDYLDAIDQWSAGAPAPEELTAEFSNGGGARTVCAHPKKQAFKGGDGRSPADFACEQAAR